MLQYKEKDELPILQIVRVQNNERVKKLNKLYKSFFYVAGSLEDVHHGRMHI